MPPVFLFGSLTLLLNGKRILPTILTARDSLLNEPDGRLITSDVHPPYTLSLRIMRSV
jgi:hypothetical protein